MGDMGEMGEEKGGRRRWRWWVAVALHSVLVLCGQSAATLLGRFYYDHGGSSMWLQTLTHSAAFPILFLPRLFIFILPHHPHHHHHHPPPPPLLKLGLAYVGLGLITAVDSLLYSYGLPYLTVSAYSLVCATQLGFNAVFSYFINGEKFTDLTLNSLVLLTFSAAIVAVRSHSPDDPSTGGSDYVLLGFVLTLAASALYSLILSLMELTFEELVRSRSLRAVLDMQICTAAASAAAAAAGLFISGEYGGLQREMEGFDGGGCKLGYVMTLIWASVGWQATNVGLVGLISEVSSLFSNVVGTLGTPFAPVFAVIRNQPTSSTGCGTTRRGRGRGRRCCQSSGGGGARRRNPSPRRRRRPRRSLGSGGGSCSATQAGSGTPRSQRSRRRLPGGRRRRGGGGGCGGGGPRGAGGRGSGATAALRRPETPTLATSPGTSSASPSSAAT